MYEKCKVVDLRLDWGSTTTIIRINAEKLKDVNW